MSSKCNKVKLDSKIYLKSDFDEANRINNLNIDKIIKEN